MPLPSPEALLMLQAIQTPCGLAVTVADVNGALARFYTERKAMANSALDDLSFKKITNTELWIMRKSRREELKQEGEVSGS